MTILFFNCTDTWFSWVVDLHCTVLLQDISNTCVMPIIFKSFLFTMYHACSSDSFGKKSIFSQLKKLVKAIMIVHGVMHIKCLKNDKNTLD